MAPFLFEVLKYSNGLLLLAALFIPLERAFGSPRLGPGYASWRGDIAYYYLTSLLPNKVVMVAVICLIWCMGYVAPHGIFPTASELPAWLRFPLSMLVAECGFYWAHRLSHASPLLWRFHALHHGATDLHWLVNTRAHPVDLVFMRLCGNLPLYVLGLARPVRGDLDWVTLAVALIGGIWGYLIHANLRWRFGWFEYILATPAFHHWHHQKLEPGDRHHDNFAALLPLMDHAFGTARPPTGGWPERYGTSERQWPHMIDQLLAPLAGRLEAQTREPKDPT